MYIRDSMTNLFNRRGFYIRIPYLFERAIEQDLELMIISTDMDGLKFINDTYGHSEGDYAIKAMAKALHDCCGEHDYPARFGGDEFIVLGLNIAPDYVSDFIARFNWNINTVNAESGKPFKLAASIGTFTVKPSPDDRVDDFIKKADDLMYINKVSRRDEGVPTRTSPVRSRDR
jgi:diguanylate cyclase (GGDEF)-like protein